MASEYDSSPLHNYTAGMFAEQYSAVVRPADDTSKPLRPDWQPAHTYSSHQANLNSLYVS